MRPLSDLEPKVSWRLNDLLRAGQKAQAFAAVSWSHSDEDTHAPFTHWQPSSIANTESDGEVETDDDIIKENDIQLLEDPVESEKQLNKLVKNKSNQGLNFSTLGFGKNRRGKDLIEELSNLGGGNYLYIQTKEEAKVDLNKMIMRQSILSK